ncbi:MAG TPA: 3'-5' exonuclease, partial [Candidatus Nanoarchaeia archaeon]|nr:3'-5' exonuclease [Candidatus Nanoarchaeia archaeon]
TMKLFDSSPGCIPKYEHVLIDEYQDVNDMQIKLIEQLNPKNIFAVGDPRQSIFGWRGANIEHIKRFKEKHPESKILGLRINYRSKQSIIDVLNSVSSPMRMPEITCCDKNAASDKDVILLEHDNEEAEHMFVVQSILNLSMRKDVFVLARTNKQIEKIAEKLKAAGIDFVKRTIEENGGEAKETQITLSTVHAIKGLEAEIVYLISANSFSFPCRASEHPILDILKTQSYDKYEEELRLLYVALSRAKSKLIISYYSSLSPFIDDKTKKLIGGREEAPKKGKPSLYDVLKRWRLEKSRELGVAAFQIFSDKTIMEICQTGPGTIEELRDVYGMGPNKIMRFGKDIVRMVIEND